MDFAFQYTEEQQRFRGEVRAWLEENIPEEMKEPADPRDFTEEMFEFWRQKHKDLAAKGWLYPTFPKEYGGGGLTGEHESIIQEEFHRMGVVSSFANRRPLEPLMVWTTEEQKQKFLYPILSAEEYCWQKTTEPHSGADLADYRSTAVRDGDDWLLTGESVFISGQGNPHWLAGPMLTDPDAPRHRNLGYFMIPNPSPGLVIKEQNLLGGRGQHQVIMDNVRVPGDHLIGGDHQGWQVISTQMEQEHAGNATATFQDRMVDNLVDFTRETKRNGELLGKDPVVVQTVMDAYLESHVDSLFNKRVYWMNQNGMDVSYQGNVHNVHSRESGLRNSIRSREVMGMYSLLDSRDPGALFGGRPEIEQRSSAGQRHAGGSNNIARVVLARRIGISRTQERAAPTRSTATSSTG